MRIRRQGYESRTDSVRDLICSPGKRLWPSIALAATSSNAMAAFHPWAKFAASAALHFRAHLSLVRMIADRMLATPTDAQLAIEWVIRANSGMGRRATKFATG